VQLCSSRILTAHSRCKDGAVTSWLGRERRQDVGLLFLLQGRLSFVATTRARPKIFLATAYNLPRRRAWTAVDAAGLLHPSLSLLELGENRARELELNGLSSLALAL